MKICLINPIFHSESSGHYKMSSDSHLGIAYIASSLIAEGHSVDLLDCAILDVTIEFVYEQIQRNNYDAVGITAYYENYVNVLRISRFVKKLKNNIFVFIGGYLPTLQFKNLKNDFSYIDCMVIGEGEITVKNLLRNIDNNMWRNISGIAYLENGQIVFTGKALSSDNLDEFSFPLRVDQKCRMARIVVSRGCRGQCVFCSLHSFSERMKCKRVRRRSALNVVEEIEQIIKFNANVELIYLSDDNFSLKGKDDKIWFDKFFELIKCRNISTQFTCEIRADDVIHSAEYLSKFKSIGLSSIFIGIESFLDSHLKFYNKGNSSKVNIDALMKLDELKIPYNLGYMLFNPIITINDILETIIILRQIEFNQINKNIIRPISYSGVVAFHGTKLAEFVKENNLNSNASFLQYNFIDKKAEFCFNIILKWKEIINTCFKVDIDVFYFYIKPTKYKSKIEDIFYRFFQIDLYILESVAIRINRYDNYKNLDYSDILEKGKKLLQELYLDYQKLT